MATKKSKEPVKVEKKLTFVEVLYAEPETMFKDYRDEKLKLVAQIEIRNKQILALQADQNSDDKRLIKVEGGLVVLHHLVTKNRTALAEAQKFKENSRKKKTKSNGRNTASSRSD